MLFCTANRSCNNSCSDSSEILKIGRQNVLKIIEENHYYPFGLKHTNYNSASNRFQSIPERGTIVLKAPVNPPGGGGGDPNADPSSVYKFKFNGQELQSEYSLNVTAMDYRQYDHAIGRFNGMDLLAELSPDTSPYRFANNNPNFWSDPTGLVDLDPVEVTIPDRSFSSFSGNTNFGASIPQFFSWGRGASIDQGFPPLPSFLGVVSVNYDITKVRQQLEPVKIQGKTKSKYSGWQKRGQIYIKEIDNWLAEHFYAEGMASLKIGSYIDAGLKHTARISLGVYDEKGYSISNKDGLKSVENRKFVAGIGMEGGAQYGYDIENEEHSLSIGYNIFTYERTGDSNFIGININLSGGIGIGGEAGVKLGFQF